MRSDRIVTGWAVMIVGSAKNVLLTGTGKMPAIFDRREDAREFRDACKSRIRSRMKVVQIAGRVELDVAA